MEQYDKIQLFENKRIRTAWDEEKEEWYFSIVDGDWCPCYHIKECCSVQSACYGSY